MQLSLFRQFKVEILPPIALAYFLVSLVVIFASSIFVEKIAIPYLEDKGTIAGYSWRKENNLIADLLKQRNLADYRMPIWHSQGIVVPITKTVGTKRILVIGDSYVFGDGSANVNTIWWRQLARELSRRGYNDVEIMAAGWDGASTNLELTWAKKIVPIYKPDMIIWGYVTNDPEEVDPNTNLDIVRQIHPPEDELRTKAESNIGQWFPQLTDQLFDIRAQNLTKRLNGSALGYEYGEWELRLLKGLNFDRYKQTINELGKFTRQTQIPAFVITLPAGSNEQAYSIRYKPVQPLFEQARIRFLNTLPDFVSLCNKESAGKTSPLWLGMNPANGHPGPLATHFFACSAADVLEHDFPKILGRKSAKANQLKINDWVPSAINFQRLDNCRFRFVYPKSNDQLLNMPVRKPFVQFNLENASQLREIKLSGPALESATTYLSYEDPIKSFDNGALDSLGYKKGPALEWTLDDTHSRLKTNTIRINAKFTGDNHLLVLQTVPP